MQTQRVFPLSANGGTGGAFTVALSPLNAFGYSPMPGGSVTTPAMTATPTGGTGPYTYAWTCSIPPNSPTASSTTFSYTATSGDFVSINVPVRCTVTDSLGHTAFATGYVGIDIGYRTGGGGGGGAGGNKGNVN